MLLVDSDGRLFGKLNLLDAVLGILLLGLIPLAYGAYALFRTPPPRLLAVEPQELVNGPDLRVLIKGENLRPFMRVSFNSIQGESFVYRNTGEAHVDLDPMPPGVYDVVLYDNAQERSRLPKAFTLLPPPLPQTQVVVVGTLGNLTAERATALKAGMTIEGVGEILAVGSPLPETTRVHAGAVLEIPVAQAVRVPVEIRAGCSVHAPQGVPQCVIANAPVEPTTMLLVPTPIGKLPLQVDQIRGMQPVEEVTVVAQFVTRRETFAQVRRGDSDYGQYMNPLAAGATVADIGAPLDVGADTVRVDIRLSTDAQRGSSGWIYAAAPLRAGAMLKLRTPRYELDGTVLSVQPEWTPTGTARNGVSQ